MRNVRDSTEVRSDDLDPERRRFEGGGASTATLLARVHLLAMRMIADPG